MFRLFHDVGTNPTAFLDCSLRTIRHPVLRVSPVIIQILTIFLQWKESPNGQLAEIKHFLWRKTLKKRIIPDRSWEISGEINCEKSIGYDRSTTKGWGLIGAVMGRNVTTQTEIWLLSFVPPFWGDDNKGYHRGKNVWLIKGVGIKVAVIDINTSQIWCASDYESLAG
jgi:hypothetical protein